MRWDTGGNDVYVTVRRELRRRVGRGVGFFVDDSGSDQYDVGGSLGGAAGRRSAVFVDGSGDDRYGAAAPTRKAGAAPATTTRKRACRSRWAS
jgi:hypothetical protein